MRSFILRAIAALAMLALLVGGLAAQGKKKRKAKPAKTSQSKPEPAKPEPTPYTGDPIPPPQVVEQGDGVRRITAAEAHDALDKGKAIIIDVRGDETYKLGHIKGALSIPVNDFVARMKDLPRDKMIITYCS
jgi:3-mercaptopyruvate sulfurtransferase SseA